MTTTDASWQVERLVPGGDGLARCPDGRAAFVQGGLPGDRIRPLRLREKRRHVLVEEWELLEAGPDRLDVPPCPWADRCGGCDWMYLARPAQLRAKAELLQDALRRIGGLQVEIAAPETIGGDLGYRTRLRLHVDRRGWLGLFERRSRRLVEIPSCAVAGGAINDALTRLRALTARAPEALAGLEELELREAPLGDPVVAVARSRERIPTACGRLLTRLARTLPVVLDGRALDREPEQAWPLPSGPDLRVPADAFVQVNPAVNRALVAAVVEGARRRGAGAFVDLYCGAGNFSLPLLAAGLAGSGIEGSRSACRAAEQSARAAGLDGRFLAGDAAPTLARLRLDEPLDLLVLDPPRTGARDAIPGIVALAPASVACVSCDPATLARDLRELAAAGYRLVEVRAFDMFPHTHHVEALAWLELSPPRPASGAPPAAS